MHTQLEKHSVLSETPIVLYWFRRDLRLEDNHALSKALQQHEKVLPLFIFDREILDTLSNKQDARVSFIYTQLSLLQKQLSKIGSTLLVVVGKPLEVFRALIQNYQISAVYANEDYEPYATRREHEVKKLLETQKIPFHLYKDQVIFAPDEILKKDKTPYTVYTPYMKQWKKQYTPEMVRSFEVNKYKARFIRTKPLSLPSWKEIGFLPTQTILPSLSLDTSLIRSYDAQRDRLEIKGTTHIGVHLRFGTISIREATKVALLNNQTWLNQLIWRNFFMMILAHFPHVVHKSFKPAYDRIPWRQDTKGFQAWCEGQTGYPIVDAGMRELNATGFMHNRARMITASFLTKLLLIDWRWGEAYFAEKLLDYELASNNGNWQWAAGTGCDAAPYFRIFNPMRQVERFDPMRRYIQKWVPEHEHPSYVKPIVDYAFARKRALEVYQKALQGL